MTAKERRIDRKNRNLCISCSNSIFNNSMCETHHKNSLAYFKAWRDKQRSKKVCKKCSCNVLKRNLCSEHYRETVEAAHNKKLKRRLSIIKRLAKLLPPGPIAIAKENVIAAIQRSIAAKKEAERATKRKDKKQEHIV